MWAWEQGVFWTKCTPKAQLYYLVQLYLKSTLEEVTGVTVIIIKLYFKKFKTS